MKPFRITIGRMMAATVLAAVLFAGLRACVDKPEMSEVIATLLLTVSSLPIVYATCRAFERRSSLFWWGFAAVGWLHFIMVPLFWSIQNSESLSHKSPLLMAIDAVHAQIWPKEKVERFLQSPVAEYPNSKEYARRYIFEVGPSQYQWRRVCYPPIVVMIALLSGLVTRRFDRPQKSPLQSQPTGGADEAPR